VAQTWSGLPHETRHVIFAAATSASGEGNKFCEKLAVFLHKHHPRTG
jgi:hypothetical protein